MDKKTYDALPVESKPEKGDTVTFSFSMPDSKTKAISKENIVIDDVVEEWDSGELHMYAKEGPTSYCMEHLTIQKKNFQNEKGGTDSE